MYYTLKIQRQFAERIKLVLGINLIKGYSSVNRQGITLDRIALFIWIFLIIFVQFFHESWRDEWQQYQIGVSINSFRDLLRISSWEVTGPAWFIIIKYIFGTLNYEIFKWSVTIFFVCSGAFFWLRSDTHLLWKLILFFNYFTLFEYGVITRTYSLQLSLFFIFVTLQKNNRNESVRYFLILLICSLNLYGLYLVLFYLIITYKEQKINFKSIISLIIGLGILSYVIIFNHGRDWGIDYGFKINDQTYSNYISFVRNFITTIFPIPNISNVNWGQSFLANEFDNIKTQIILLILITIFYAFVLKPLHTKNRYLIAMIFVYICHNLFIFAGALRHIGFLYILILFFLIERVNLNKYQELAKLNKVILSTFVLAHFIYAISFLQSDVKKSFSTGKELSKPYDKNSLFISYPDWVGTSFLGYSNSKGYFPQDGRYSNFLIWTRNRLRIVEKLPSFCPTKRDVYLITTESIGIKVIEDLSYVNYIKSGSSIASDEGKLYKIQLSSICSRNNWENFIGVISE